MNEKDSSELIADVQLLTDIYWLDGFEVKTDKGQEIFQRPPKSDLSNMTFYNSSN
ncbi:hypothetical protein ACPV5O_03875 [Vibrio maritimus]|uniref:hypothetical protein n=1 Tax=Vibrio maritimus TaxID=990268 RepID=UPI004069470B